MHECARFRSTSTEFAEEHMMLEAVQKRLLLCLHLFEGRGNVCEVTHRWSHTLVAPPDKPSSLSVNPILKSRLHFYWPIRHHRALYSYFCLHECDDIDLTFCVGQIQQGSRCNAVLSLIISRNYNKIWFLHTFFTPTRIALFPFQQNLTPLQ